MSNNKKYGEETKMVCFRVPESKESEIKQMIKLRLNEYEKDVLMLSERQFSETPIESELKPFISEGSPVHLDYVEYPEKKSDPADDVLIKAEAEQKKYDNLETAREISSRVKVVDKKVDMDALRKIASGQGLKGGFELTKKKVNIDEIYDFTVGKLPEPEYRVIVDKKGIAMVDQYNPGIVYVVWEGRNLLFEERSEFDRFAKNNGIILI